MDNTNVPRLIKVIGIIVIIITLVQILQLDKAINAEICRKRAREADKMGNYSVVIEEYQKVLNYYPNYTFGRSRIALAQLKNGDYVNAAQTLEMLKGKDIDKRTADEINYIIMKLQGEITNGH